MRGYRGHSRLRQMCLKGALFCAALAAAACSAADTEMPGKKIFERICGQCHSIERPLSKNKDIEGWHRTVTAMRARGAKLNDEEAQWVVEYLHAIRPEK